MDSRAPGRKPRDGWSGTSGCERCDGRSARVAVTIADVLLRGKEPTKEEVATVLMPSKELGEYQEQTEKKARRRTHARSN